MASLRKLLVVLFLLVPTFSSAQTSFLFDEEKFVTAGICDTSGPYAPNFNSEGTGLSYTCETGKQFADLTFADSGADVWVEYRWQLPARWASTIGLDIYWSTSATSNNVVWQVKTACVGTSETLLPTLNAAQTVTDAADATTLDSNIATISSLTTTGCSSAEIMVIRIYRNSSHASDTIAAAVKLHAIRLTYKRRVNIN